MTSAAPSLFDARRSGVLLHPTSLPGPHGCGDFGPEACHFVDWLATAGQSVWQVLPLNPVGAGNSPYQSVSTFAGSPLLVDLASLVERGWLGRIADPGFEPARSDLARAAPWRMALLRDAWQGFSRRAEDGERKQLQEFRRQQSQWLDDYALFMALADPLGDDVGAFAIGGQYGGLPVPGCAVPGCRKGAGNGVSNGPQLVTPRLPSSPPSRKPMDDPLNPFEPPSLIMEIQNPTQLARRTIALVLAGGRGSRLAHLTDLRAKPAVYFGGKFRIVDFALSNCLNSGVRRIGVLTQYKSHSLLRHLQRGWSFLRNEFNEFIDLLPAQQRMDEELWYRGTADAVYQNLDILSAHNPKYMLVLAGDHVYKMDYAKLIADHVAMDARCTVACIEVPLSEASAFGVMHVDLQRRIIDFLEKPAEPPSMPGKPDRALASMGVYVFDADYLYEALRQDSLDPVSNHDFGKDLIPSMVAQGQAMAHPFEMSCVRSTQGAPSYWRDVGTVDAYWQANLDLTDKLPELDMYDAEWPIWTYQEQLPPAKFVHDEDGRRGHAIDSLVSGGCIISGSRVRRSVLFSSVHVHSYASVEESVLLPEVDVGEKCELRRVVADKGCRIPAGMRIGFDAGEDARLFHRTGQGVVLVTRDMLQGLETQPASGPE